MKANRLFFGILLMCQSSLFADTAAVVVRAGGDAFKATASGIGEPLVRRDELFEGDRVVTGADSYLTLKFSDQSVVDLGENSELFIRRFQLNGNDNDSLLLELLSGRIRTVTGALSNSPDAFRLQTDNASIAVRGTEFEVLLLDTSDTLVYRYDGIITVRNLASPETVLTLPIDAEIARVTGNSPPTRVTKPAVPGEGPLPPSILELAAATPFPEASTFPLAAELSADGATPLGDGDDSDGPITALATLVNDKRWSDARVLADNLMERFEGLPRFDLYHGLVLLNEDRHEEAVLSFERVLMFEPSQHRARLELGRAYYLSGNYPRARDALEQVLTARPPGNVRSAVNQLLALIDAAERRQRNQTIFGGSLALGWDTNANSGGSLDEPLDSNLLGLTSLDGASLAEDSLYAQWSVYAGLIEPLSQRSERRYLIDFSNRNFIDQTIADSSAITGSVRYSRQSEHWRLSLPAAAQLSWVEGQFWATTFSASLQPQYQLLEPLWAGVNVGTEISIAINGDNRTTVKDSAGVAFAASEQQRSHRLSSSVVNYSLAGVNDEHNEWFGIENRYQLTAPLPWRTQVSFAASHEWHRHKDEDLLFTVNENSNELKLRQDQIFNLRAQLALPITPLISSQTQAGWETVASNINAYSRERWLITQTINIRFVR